MRNFLVLLLVLGAASVFGQTIGELEEQLKNANGAKEKMLINYQLSEAWMRQDAKKSIEHGKTAHRYATEIRNNGMSAQTAFLIARGYNRINKQERNEEIWFKSALKYAKQAHDSDLIIKSVEKLSQLAIKSKRDYRKAYQITEEAFTYFSQGGTSISELEREYEMQKAQLAKDKKRLEQEKKSLEGDIGLLVNERDDLKEDKTVLSVRQKELEQEKQLVEEEIAQKEEEIKEISASEAKALYIAERRKGRIESIEAQQALDSLELNEAKLELENAQLLNEQGKYLFILLGAVSLFVVLLAILFYMRYNSKRKSNAKLEEQNKIIDAERERSDELLLNILPASIATELKEKGKATARKFPEATVFFSDFKNFTKMAEQLSPEQLVEELDSCFKAFDYIISQYEDIEKIKTIGDAYMCASGLVDRKTIPFNMVKAATEMQQYLQELKQDKMSRNEPYFEARIGIHTGPVVAGVVGNKKFAYDIWGDTVNIAARMEANCEVGKVNVSEVTQGMIKYKFNCQYRGKVDVKNKGMMDMYYVRA